MHARQLLSLASTLASVGHALNRREVHASGDAAHGYWLANRFRCDAWHKHISHHRTAIERCGTSRRTRLWTDILPTLEEILASEPLTRVIAYMAALLELRSADGDWSALSHSVLASHIEARLRCLNLMVFGHGFPVEQAVRLNRLRRMMEFTSDCLISSLPTLPELDSYGFDIPLIVNQQKQFRLHPVSHGVERIRIETLVTSAERTIQRDHANQSANPRLNESIAEAALGLLPPELFDSFGLAQSRMHSLATYSSGDIEVATDDFDHPVAEPFDLFMQPRRHGIEKSRRRL